MYAITSEYIAKRCKAFCSMHTETSKVTTFLVWGLVIVLLILSGVAYRVLASRLQLIADTPVRLPVPLSAFPSEIGSWVGTELPIPTTAREYMEKNFADDFFSRRYINSINKAWADVYVVYCSSRPGGILGHQPRICYPGFGWVHDGTERSRFVSRAGQEVPCLMHRFHKPEPAQEQTIVLNFYILNGQITADESDFSGPFGRRPNIARDPARYVAQVQISSILENSIRAAAENMTDLILDYLPDRNGQIKHTADRKQRADF